MLAAMTRYQWTRVQVACYGTLLDREVLATGCLWDGALKGQLVQVVLVRPVGAPDGCDLALVSTDLAATPAALVERYADRWSAETTFLDARHLAGVGQARTRTRRSVERLVPFAWPATAWRSAGTPATATPPATWPTIAPARPGTGTSTPSRSQTCSPRSGVPSWPPNIAMVTLTSTASTYSQTCCSASTTPPHNPETRVP
jgi:hypothetical protein